MCSGHGGCRRILVAAQDRPVHGVVLVDRDTRLGLVVHGPVGVHLQERADDVEEIDEHRVAGCAAEGEVELQVRTRERLELADGRTHPLELRSDLVELQRVAPAGGKACDVDLQSRAQLQQLRGVALARSADPTAVSAAAVRWRCRAEYVPEPGRTSTIPRISRAASASRTAERPTPSVAASCRSGGRRVPGAIEPLVKRSRSRRATSETGVPLGSALSAAEMSAERSPGKAGMLTNLPSRRANSSLQLVNRFARIGMAATDDTVQTGHVRESRAGGGEHHEETR